MASFPKPKDYQNIKVGADNQDKKELEIGVDITDSFDESEEVSENHTRGGE